MAVAVALVVALALGLLADTTTRALRKAPSGRRTWWRPLADFGADVGLLVTRRDRVAVVEAVGAGLGMLGGTLAAAGAVGAAPGNAPFLYLALALAAMGGHAAASLSDIRSAEYRASRARLRSVLVEPAFVLGLAAGFIRWQATDLQAVRGAHHVLGSGLEVGPPLATAGLIMAVLVVVAAGALRLPPERGNEAGTGGGPSVLVALCRWSLSGATVLVAGAFLAGGEPALGGGWPLDRTLLPVVLAAAAGALLLGGIRAALDSLPRSVRPLAGWAAAVLGAIALELVILG
jgi:hypothetical protein